MIDICVLTCNRISFLKQVVFNFEERIKTAYRLIVINNNSKDGTNEYLEVLKNSASYPVIIIHNKDGEEQGLCGAYTQALRIVESELFITSQDDILVPDLDPCALTQLIDLFKRNPEYGSICLRTINMKKGPIEGDELIRDVKACPGVFRIQNKLDMVQCNGFGHARRWEDSEMARIMNNIGKKCGIAANIWARDLGLAYDRGYPQWYRDSVKNNYNRNFEWVAKNRPNRGVGEVDPKTHKPL